MDTRTRRRPEALLLALALLAAACGGGAGDAGHGTTTTIEVPAAAMTAEEARALVERADGRLPDDLPVALAEGGREVRATLIAALGRPDPWHLQLVAGMAHNGRPRPEPGPAPAWPVDVHTLLEVLEINLSRQLHGEHADLVRAVLAMRVAAERRRCEAEPCGNGPAWYHLRTAVTAVRGEAHGDGFTGCVTVVDERGRESEHGFTAERSGQHWEAREAGGGC